MKKLTSKVIWLFAIGQLGWSILSALVTNWIITFYEPDTEMLKAGQTLFLPQGRMILGVFTILGGIYALGRVFDAVTDPWIANLSDRSRNPKGRRLPFMRRAALPLAVVTVLVYCAPVNGQSSVNGVWVLAMMLLFYLFMTLYCTPYNALIAELPKNQEELTRLSTAISFTFIFGSALGYACPFIWGALTPALGRVLAIRVTFTVLAVIAFVCLLVPTFTIREQDYVEIKPVSGNAFQSLAKTFKNRDFRIFVGSDVCYWVRKITKKRMIVWAFIEFSAVYLITAVSTGQAGTNKGMIFGILVMVIAAPSMAILGILPQTVVADIARSDEITTGENHDGMFFAARTFAMKMGQSLAALLFTSFATIGRSAGTGYRIAAVSSTVLCLLAAVLMSRYDEKKVICHFRLCSTTHYFYCNSFD